MALRLMYMKLFKQKGWGCEHNFTRRDKERACQKCLRHDWFWMSKGGQIFELSMIIIVYPFWWLKWGRNMDKRGFMKGEKNYKKE